MRCLFLLLLCPSLVVAQDGPRVTAEKVKGALPRLEKYINATMTKTGTPGLAVAIVYQDEVVYLKGFGVRKAGSDDAVDADTVFQLASVSKPMASTVVAALVGEGVVGWDDRLVDRLPGFQLHDPWITRAVRIRDMLSHRSGLPDHAGDLLEDLGYDRAQILQRLRYQKKFGEFRVDYAYTNFGYTAGCEAAAHAAKVEWAELCAQKLYRPLGMSATSSKFADYAARKNRAVGHVKEGEKYVARFTRQPDAQSPAGGVSSSVRDMAQYLRLQLGNGKFAGKQIVAAKALAETHAPQVISGYNSETKRASLYGLGWNVAPMPNGLPFWNHSGAFSLGASTQISLLPDQQLGIVVLVNTAPEGVPEAVSLTFYDLVLHDKPTRDWLALMNKMISAAMTAPYQTDYSKKPAEPAKALPAAAYVGTYHTDYFGDLEIVSDNGKLIMKLGPKERSYPLTHWNRDVFHFQPDQESAGGLAGVTFTIGAAGQATQVVVENLNVDGEGTFQRVPAKK